MVAWSEVPSVAEAVPPALLAEGATGTEPLVVEDEEFPADLPLKYDWLLQPASQRTATRVRNFLAVVVAVALIAGSVLLVRAYSQSIPKLLASPGYTSK